MAGTPTDRRYSTSHEWVKMNGTSATMGITAYNVSQRGQVTSISLSQASGATVAQGDSLGTIHGRSNSATFSAAIGGSVTNRNEHATDINTVNQDPYADSSLIISLSNASQSQYNALMIASEYDAYVSNTH